MPVTRRYTYAMAKRAHFRLGEKGERLAVRLLRELGMDLLCRNYVGPHGELDIVARDGEMLVFVEVKTRRERENRIPGGTLSPTKKWHIIHTANRYLRELGHPPMVYRFDLVEIIFSRRQVTDVRHFPAAFSRDDIRETRSGQIVDA